MREILFRGKRIENSEWVEGYFCADAIEQLYGCNTGMDGFIRRFDPEIHKSNMFEVDRETVGQFTGLTDRNGTKIFEGDVVKFKYFDDWIGKIEYDSDSALFTVIFADGDDDYFGRVSCGDCEVIGNIYDNPELLEVSKSD